MTKIFLFGICGKMGNAISSCIENYKDVELSGGFDLKTNPNIPTFNDINTIDAPFDVIVDFTRPEALNQVLALAEKSHVPVVLATTGYSETQQKQIDESSKKVAVFQSGNMSVGINLILNLVTQATKILADSFDIEVVEKHHNMKVDAPSGTAKMIADAIANSMTESNFVYGRHGNDALRKKNDIGIHSLRGGTIVGEHEALFCGEDEIITISHTALSRKIFANGAIKAALFMKDKKSGKFNMNDVLNFNK